MKNIVFKNNPGYTRKTTTSLPPPPPLQEGRELHIEIIYEKYCIFPKTIQHTQAKPHVITQEQNIQIQLVYEKYLL